MVFKWVSTHGVVVLLVACVCVQLAPETWHAHGSWEHSRPQAHPRTCGPIDVAQAACQGDLLGDELGWRMWSEGPTPSSSTTTATTDWTRTKLALARIEADAPSVKLLPGGRTRKGHLEAGHGKAAGIPMSERHVVDTFVKDNVFCARTELMKRAAEAKPTVPMLALAHFHRTMLGAMMKDMESSDDGTAAARVARLAARRIHWKRASGVHSVINSINESLVALKYQPDWTIVDAGCGWGRNGIPIIQALDHSKYFGLEVDEFELRAFIQVEVALERPELVKAKNPSFLLSADFEFERLLHDSGPADIVLFSSVLKKKLGAPLLTKALVNAKSVLRKPSANSTEYDGGFILVMNDCDAHIDEMTKAAGLVRTHLTIASCVLHPRKFQKGELK